jgi:PIN domain nuclease of toxin-antitoxin system
MKVLLDTHILLWALSNDPKLPPQAREMIENPSNEIFFSLLSLWEVQIKHSLHPEALPLNAQALWEYCQQAGFPCLTLKPAPVFSLENLQRSPEAPPHKDPFDRLLICQAASENIVFLTHDKLLSFYNMPCIFVV